MFKIKNKKAGYLLIQVLVFGTIGLIVVGGLIGFAGTSLKYSNYLGSREQALAIAEAGLDYYRWHLAHAPQDFQDGTGHAGPYVHSFVDKNNNVIGQFTLNIIAPMIGSTIVTVQSKGEVFDGSGAKRTLESKLAIPSLAKYAIVSNTDMRFGEGTEVFGPIHSNGGIRFDGLAHNLITSALASYDDPDHNDNNNKSEFGVHTHVNAPPSSGINEGFHSNEAPPTSPAPSRTDVFGVGRQFPVPAVDFTGLLANLATIKAGANTTSGVYLAGSGVQGYHLVLKTDDTFDVYKITAIKSPDRNCSNPDDKKKVDSQDNWGSWSILSETFYKNYAFPANGLVFVEDNTWVSGNINTARLTIAAARDGVETSITVNEDLRYTNYDGQDVLSLIAQDNINVGQYSADTIRIDGALIAKDGRVGRYYYGSNCDNHTRSSITLYGMISTWERYGFAYTDGSGYQTRNIIYDGNLLYGPPPSFPLTGDQYQTISWREI